MSFLSPIWLPLAGLAAVVVALHMFRRRQVEVPSTLIWRLLEHTSRSRQRLHLPKLTLPLLLQVAIVLLAAIALAQPLLGSKRQNQHTIYVLDTSGSMRATDVAPSRFDKAVGDLAEGLSADATHRVSLVAVGGSVQLVAARQDDAAAISALLEQLSPSDSDAAWDELPSRLDGIVRAYEATRIVVITDGGDEAVSAIEAYSPDVEVERRIVAGTDFANAGLVVQLRPAKGPVNSWQVDGSVSFSGRATGTTVSMAFKPEGGKNFLQWATIPVAAPTADGRGGAREVHFSQTYEFPSAGILSLSLTDDAGPADNAQSFVLRSAPRTLRVLYLGDGNKPVEQALLAVPGVELFAGDSLPSDDGSFDFVVADGVTLPRAPATNVLWLGAARLADEAEPAIVENRLATGWNDDHPLSAGVDWSQTGAAKTYRFAPLPGAAVLLQADDVPLVQARTVPAGREVRLAMDIEAGKWQEVPGFPVFVHNLLGWLGVKAGALVESGCVAGAACTFEARYLAGPVFSPTGERLDMPVGKSGDWLLEGADEGFVPQRAGLYVVGEGASARTLAVNSTARESDLNPHVTPSGKTAFGVAALGIWWWVAAAVLLLLVIEAVVAGLGTERFLRLAALRQGSPLAGRRRWMLGLRLAAVAAVVAALVLLPLPAMEPSEETVLIVDSGFKTGDVRRDALLTDLIDRECGDGGNLGLVALGNSSRVAADMGCGLSVAKDETVDASENAGANVLDALQTAAAMVAPGRRGRLIVAADGNETVGNLAHSIPALNARGIAVDVLPLKDMLQGDVLVQAVEVPPRVFQGDTFPIETIVFSSVETNAHLVVTADGTVVSEQDVHLVAGRNRVETVVRNAPAGTVRYEVSARSPDDPTPANDKSAAIVDVAAKPRIAVITPQVGWGQYFSNALDVQGLAAEVMDPSMAPVSMEDWLDYDAVVLMNLPAVQLDTRQQQQIEQLVRVHGRGLMILGGENSYGPGGYYQTPLEDLSPLSSKVPKEEPVSSIVFVIDRSGSMYAPVGGVSRLDIAKQATADAIELLPEDTEVGVVMFNSKADAVIPVQPRKALASVDSKLAPVKPLGGTSLVVAVDEALDQLKNVDAPIRHIVAMSDGLAQPMAFETVLKRAIEMDVTLSIVAIGDVADAERLADVAKRGSGAFHQTRDFRALPSIMAQEAMMLNGPPVEKRTAAAVWMDREAPFLAGLRDELPPINSYVRTTAKPQARLHMAVREDDGALTPILASWTYGNGRVLSLATHGAGAGTADWASLQEYPKLWAQPLRHFLSAAQGQGLHLSLDRSGDEIIVDADFLDQRGQPVSGGELTASLRRQAETSFVDIKLSEIAPGHYQGRAAVASPGLYEVAAAAGDRKAVAAIDITYPARLDFSRADADKLAALSRATGGRVLRKDELSFNSDRTWSLQPNWQPWLLLALAFLLVDLVLRYAPGLLDFLRFPRSREGEVA